MRRPARIAGETGTIRLTIRGADRWRSTPSDQFVCNSPDKVLFVTKSGPTWATRGSGAGDGFCKPSVMIELSKLSADLRIGRGPWRRRDRKSDRSTLEGELTPNS
jgi:hypothetical protein